MLNYSGKINVVIYDAENQQIKDLMERATGGKRYNVIAIKEGISNIYAISEALARNEIVVMHADKICERQPNCES